MTKEEYAAGQEASGIEVGDEVRATRHFSENEGGSNLFASSHTVKTKFIDDKAVGTVSRIFGGGIQIKYDGCYCEYPYFVLEIVKKADGSVPGKIETLITGESTMKTQGIFSVVVTENEKIKDDNGQIESIKKRVIFSKSDLPAYDEANAHVKATLAAGKVKGEKAIRDADEV